MGGEASRVRPTTPTVTALLKKDGAPGARGRGQGKGVKKGREQGKAAGRREGGAQSTP